MVITVNYSISVERHHMAIQKIYKMLNTTVVQFQNTNNVNALHL